jgi:ABC-type methionine transport system permease subunit
VGGWVETVIMRIADVQLTFPAILVAMLIFGIAKGITPPEYRDQMAIWVLILAIGLSDWVQFARVVRGATLVEKSKEYVQAARLIGRSPFAIMLRHILPNVLSPVLVIATISLALAIIAEATLSFLGVGAPPTEPSLGTLIRIGQGFLFSGEWWILFFPACTLLTLALAVNLLGDWLRDALNPRLAVMAPLRRLPRPFERNGQFLPEEQRHNARKSSAVSSFASTRTGRCSCCNGLVNFWRCAERPRAWCGLMATCWKSRTSRSNSPPAARPSSRWTART